MHRTATQQAGPVVEAGPFVETGPTAAPSLERVFRAAADGDQEAWRTLISHFQGMIAAIGRRHGLGHSDVGELQQTTWLRLIEHMDRIEHPERIGGWLATTARRETFKLVARGHRFQTGADTMLANMADPASPELDAGPLARERNGKLEAAWNRLRPRCQRLLALLIADDFGGYNTLSEVLDMPIGSIGPTRGRCLEHLRRLVAEEGITEA